MKATQAQPKRLPEVTDTDVADGGAIAEPVTLVEQDSDAAPQPAPTPVDPPVERPKGKAGEPRPTQPAQSTIIKGIVAEEERSLKAMLDDLGQQGSFRVQVRRTEPKFVRVHGKDVGTAGFLESYDHSIDETFLKQQWGGGTYVLRVTQADPKTGSFQYRSGMGFNRTVVIAGEPDLSRLPTNQGPAVAPVASGGGESPAIAKVAMDAMAAMLDRKDPPRGIDPAMQMMVDQLTEQGRSREREITALRQEITAMRNQKPEGDPMKDEYLRALIGGNAGQVEALRLRQESELRQTKEGYLQEIQRREDRHDRTVHEMRQAHDMAIATIKASYEREIAAMRSTQEILGAAGSATHNVQLTTLRGDITRLERDNEAGRREISELRAKKDQSPIEMLKQVEALKDALGGGEESSSAWGKLAELLGNPAAIEGIVGAVRGQVAPAKPPVQATVVPSGPRVVRAPDGSRFIQQPNGSVIPVKKKPKVVPQEDGTQLEIPEIPAANIEALIGYLERAFNGNQDPVIVAQSGRPNLPAEILSWIQAHHTEQVNGVDLFMSQVAKLPGTSPLSTQSGRNWLRKVGKALVGG